MADQYIIPRLVYEDSAPSTNDDINDGIVKGQVWIDTTTDKTYICSDNTVSAAIWKEIDRATLDGHVFGSTELDVKTFKFKRGTEATRSSVTPDVGEPVFTTDNRELFIGDGSSAGGNPLLINSMNIKTSSGSYLYNTNGQMSSVTYGDGKSISYTYDSRYRLYQELQYINAVLQTTYTYGYNSNGDVTSRTKS